MYLRRWCGEGDTGFTARQSHADFEREQLIEEEVLRCRSAKEFEGKYLKKGFEEKIIVYRILDSRSENFKISKAYKHKIDIVNVVTARKSKC